MTPALDAPNPWHPRVTTDRLTGTDPLPSKADNLRISHEADVRRVLPSPNRRCRP